MFHALAAGVETLSVPVPLSQRLCFVADHHGWWSWSFHQGMLSLDEMARRGQGRRVSPCGCFAHPSRSLLAMKMQSLIHVPLLPPPSTISQQNFGRCPCSRASVGSWVQEGEAFGRESEDRHAWVSGGDSFCSQYPYNMGPTSQRVCQWPRLEISCTVWNFPRFISSNFSRHSAEIKPQDRASKICHETHAPIPKLRTRVFDRGKVGGAQWSRRTEKVSECRSKARSYRNETFGRCLCSLVSTISYFVILG